MTSSAVRFEERRTVPEWMAPALFALSVPPGMIALALVFLEEGVSPVTIAIVVVSAILIVAPLLAISRAELLTQVRADGVYVRYWPFHRSFRRVPFEDLEDVKREKRRSYSYGIKRTRSGWEYTADSSDGVRIYRTSGKPIFLGSDRPHELLTAIEAAKRDRQ